MILAGDTANFIGGISTSWEQTKKDYAISEQAPTLQGGFSQADVGRIETTRLLTGNKDTTPIIKKDPSVTQAAATGLATGILSQPGNFIAGLAAGSVNALGFGGAALATNLTGGANANYRNPALEALTGRPTPQVSGGNPIADFTGAVKKTVFSGGGGGGGGGGLFNFGFGDAPLSNPSLSFDLGNLPFGGNNTVYLPFGGNDNQQPGSNPVIIMPGGTGTNYGTSGGTDWLPLILIGGVVLGGAYLLTNQKGSGSSGKRGGKKR